jgi:hypothetical protein
MALAFSAGVASLAVSAGPRHRGGSAHRDQLCAWLAEASDTAEP